MKSKSNSQRSRTNWNPSNLTYLAMLTLIMMLAINTGTAIGDELNLFNSAPAENQRVDQVMDLENRDNPPVEQPPNPPYALSATVTVDDNQVHEVHLEWRDATYVDGFRIERRTNANLEEPWEVIAIVGASEFSDLMWQDSIVNGYRVQAFKNGLLSDYSEEVIVEFVRP